MPHLTSRPGRRSAERGRAGSPGASRGRRAAQLLVGSATILLALGGASAAWANAAAPTDNPPQTSKVIDNSNGTVTVTVTGSWVWEFSLTPKTTQGIDVDTAHPCDDRVGVGWAVIWNDPNDPGYPETFQTANGKATVNLGAKSLLDGNAQGSVLWNKTDPCGTFVQTNTPNQGDGYIMGQWTATHTYTTSATVPASICGVMYDLGPGKKVPGHREQKLSQNDNSVWWSLYNTGTWSPTDGNPGCVTLSAPVSPPPTTVTTAAVVVKTTPPTSPPPATAPAHSLAFTGVGPIDDALGILGAVLVILGVFMFFFGADLRRALLWIVGL